MFTFFKNWRIDDGEKRPYNKKTQDLLYSWKNELISMQEKK